MSATLAARARNDASLSMPPRRISGGRRKPVTITSRLMRFAGRRPGKAVLALLFTAIAAAIVVNALMFQKVRHPAPMLSAPATTTAPAPARTATETRVETPAAAAPVGPVQQSVLPPSRPVQQREPVQREAAPRPPAPVAPVATRAVHATPAPAAAARPAAVRDPIADLINGDLRPPAEIRQARPATARRTAEN